MQTVETHGSAAPDRLDDHDATSVRDRTPGVTGGAPPTAPPTQPPASRTRRQPWRANPRFETYVSVAIIALSVLVVFWIVDGRDVLFNRNTTTGGDMGAHVWTGDFVWRKLLTQGRVTGWSDDWFAGFPVLGFYFPLPFWVMTGLNVILPYNIAFKIVTVLGLLLYPVTGWALGHHAGLKKPLPVFLGLATIPYMVDRQWEIYGGNVSSTMAGEFSFTLSVACALLFLGLLSKVMRTGQRRASAGIVLAMVGLSHLLPTIWVGAAGAFVILTHLDKRRTNLRNAYAVFAASAAVASGMWFTGFHRAGVMAAAVVALGAVLYDQFTKKLGLGQFGDAFAAVVTGTALALFWIWPFWNHLDYSNDMGYEKEKLYLNNLFPWTRQTPPPGSAVFFFAFALALVGAVASFGSLVHAIARVRRDNPQRWHSVGILFCALTGTAGTAALWPWISFPAGPDTNLVLNMSNVLRVGTFVLITAVMLVVMFAWEVDDDWNRLAVALSLVTAACGILYRVIPVGFRLWNNRVLPFWMLGTFLLAAIGLHALMVFALTAARLYAGKPNMYPAARLASLLGALVVVHAAVALPLGAVPGDFPAPTFSKRTVTTQPADGGTPVTTTVGGWMVGLQRAKDSSDYDNSAAKLFPPGNYRGYEGQGAGWVDYKRIIDTMAKVGREHGCGRAQWEVEGEQTRWGTSLALMLLPYWTKSCIGSMEGLYFESSATAPYHWINAGLVSKEPSNPQRNLPYKALDVAAGVKKLQQWGVRYYMAFSPAALAQADVNPDLEVVATAPYQRACLDQEIAAKSCPTTWKIYLVKGSEIVEPLTIQPVVATGIGQSQLGGWLDLAMAQYNRPESYPVPFAADGPNKWQRVNVASGRTSPLDTFGDAVTVGVPTTVALPAVKVSNIETSFTGQHPLTTPGSVRFSVDKVGVPVVIKMSYFPNFRVTGADGPYRLAPNMMVVIPRQRDVSLTYGWSGVDFTGIVAGVGGIALAAMLWRQDRRRRPAGVAVAEVL